MKRAVTHFLLAGLLLVMVFPSLSYPEARRFDVPIGNSPSIGPEGTPVVIIEFVDYP